MGTDDSAWFATRSQSAIRDFFDIVERSPDALQVSARELEHAGGPLTCGSVAERVVEARAWMRQARTGDWRCYEHHLMTDGARYARSGLPLSAWYVVANRFHDAITARGVAIHSSEPARLTQVLLAVSEFLERSLSLIAREYRTADDEREREAAARHSRMIDAAPDAVIEIDDRGEITEWNVAAERTFGFARADALGRLVSALIIPERLRERHDTGVAHVLASCTDRAPGKRRELTAVRADGSELQIELTLIAAGRTDGSRSIVGHVRDLSEQLHADESRALRDHALEQAQFGIVVSNPETREIINVNPAYARIVGYEPSELIGSTGDRLAPAGSDGHVAEIARTLRERGHLTFELRLLRKDGTTVPVLVSSSTIETRSGTQMRISSVVDISHRDELERTRAAAKHALERSAARLEILSETGHELAAASGHLDRLLALVARRLGEIIGEGCSVRLISLDGQWLEPTTSFYHPDPEIREFVTPILASARERVGDGLGGRVAATGIAELVPVIDIEAMLPLAAPAFRPMIVRMGVSSALAIPLRSRERTVGVISFLRSHPGNPYTLDDQRLAQDLADRAGLAIDNAVLVATLEQRVTERTAALEAANRDLESFSYSVSHDLRTPLRAIDGFSRVLMTDYDARLDDRAQHYLHRIRTATQRMASLIDDLLNLARITQTPLDLEVLDLSALAAEVVSELERREPGRGIQAYIASGVSARGDSGLIRVVLENLFGNAWKFTARHAGSEIWFGADDGGFFIKDTGVGFDMAYAQKLFMPFQRLHSVKDYEGTGIGLATVHRIVTRHGGRIWAEAAVGKGATFHFTLGPLGPSGPQGDSHGRSA